MLSNLAKTAAASTSAPGPAPALAGAAPSPSPSPAADADADASTSTTTASPSAQPEEEKIILLSSDGVAFEVSVAVALQSGILKQAIEDDCVASGVPIPNVPSRLLSMVLEHMNAKHGLKPADFAKFEAEFVGNLDRAVLFEVIMAANYLDTKALLGAACQRVANMMSKMTPEEIREEFGIVNDFTPEEEAAVREEVAWAFD